MLLRSSSTPVLGSLLSSFSDGGRPSHHGHHEAASPAAVAAVHKAAALHNHHNFSFHPKGSLNFSSISCNSSPISPSVHDLGGDAPSHHKGGFRRVQSEANLEGLAQAYNMSPLSNSEDQFHTASHAKKSSARSRSMMLETIPSFSFDRYGYGREDEDEENSDFDLDEREEYEEYDEAPLVESRVMFRGSKSMSLIAEEEASSVGSVNMIEKSGFEGNKERVRQEMYLALGLGGGGGGGDGGRRGGWGSNSSHDGADGENNQGVEEYYKKMVEESPNNSLFLRNYAQFLYQTQGDLERAEEYYARAILVDPLDGEILSQYAKLVWELHRDQPRASTYFERAVRASPEDSHVQAAYASFLWEVDDDKDQGEDEDEYEASLATYAMSPQFQGQAAASIGA